VAEPATNFSWDGLPQRTQAQKKWLDFVDEQRKAIIYLINIAVNMQTSQYFKNFMATCMDTLFFGMDS
jgi:hypothetical protein